MSSLFPLLSEEASKTLASIPALVEKAFPIPARFRAALPADVAELFRFLTYERTERGASYLGKPALLSAYLRYYLPWNIYRLCRLFAALPVELKGNDAINDLGAGPLTLAISLWISRPDLRDIPLEFRCLDKTAAVLDAGKKLFAALTANVACPWTVRTIRGELRGFGRQGGRALSVEIRGKPAALSAAVNVYNELFWDLSPVDKEGLGHFASSQARLLSSLTESSGSVLVVEPGIPRSGEFISLLRSSLIKEKRLLLSPCPHCGLCPLPGGRSAKWCHFALSADDAPEELHRLSAAMKLPKERVALSFVLVGKASAQKSARRTERTKIRIISDCFPLSADSPGARSLPGIAHVIEENAKKHSFRAFYSLQTPKGAHKSEDFEADSRKILPVQQAPRGHESKAWGRYGCSEHGLVLVTGNRRTLEASPPGTLEELALERGMVDAKSGACIARKP